MSIKGKLNRLKTHIIKDDQEKAPRPPVREHVEEIPYLDMWKSFGAEPFFFDGDYCFVRTIEYPLTHQHGLYTFSKLNDIVDLWEKVKLNHPLSSKGHKSTDLFFFDTETTGLGGGVGNTIFLLGHARIQQDKVILKQHFLPKPGAEIALYQSFLSSVDYKTLVTYNGKAFDWPQVKTRHTLIRDALPKLPEFGHFDLYHASRRLWKSKLESVRLANVEKEMLNIHRENDVPGFLAPILYFDFLETQNPEGIFGILEHNETDILSLITLYIHLSGIILSNKSEQPFETYEVARWLETLGETKKAQQLYEEVAFATTEAELSAKLALAFLYKKQSNVEQAIAFFHEVQEKSKEAKQVISARIELAKHYEHKAKDFDQALLYTKLALELYEMQPKKDKEQSQKEIQSFEKRLSRIMKKRK